MADESEQEQRIRERAFRLWIDEGQPEGRDKEHWERAEKELGGVGEPRSEAPPLQPEPIGEIKYAAARTVGQGGD